MERTRDAVSEVFNVFLDEKLKVGTASKNITSYKNIVNEIPELFRRDANLPNSIIVKGSIGQGNITEIPWICFFDAEITNSAQHGYYVCILFCADMSGFYLSLNQGWEQYEKAYKKKQGKIEIRINSNKANALLRSVSGFDTGRLNLKTAKRLGEGYELGNIYSHFYSASALPDDKKLFEDLHQLLGAYRELKGLVGPDILNIRSSGSEENFQEEVQKTLQIEIKNGPIEKPNQITKNTNFGWSRNPAVAKWALIEANYLCEIDNSHVTFLSKASGKPYVEVHHLIPMEKQEAFDISLDVPDNIVALCPNCHRKIHLASNEEKEPILEKLLALRNDGLKNRGITISMDSLKEIYRLADLDTN